MADTARADTIAITVPPPTAEALSYYRSGNVLWVAGTVWGLAVPALLLFTGCSARLRRWARQWGRGRWLATVAIYAVLFVTAAGLLTLPLLFYAGYVRPHAYGLSNQTLAAWTTETLTAWAVGSVLAAATLWIPYLLIRRSPRRWWVYTALALIPVIVLLQLVAPVVIDPLFDRFGPLRDQALAARIVAVAERAGIERARVLQVDKRQETEAVNAYVTGIGGTKRIVLWDTLVDKLEDDEVVFVAAHEIGHYVLGHLATSIVAAVVLLLAALWAVHRLAGGAIRRWADRFGFSELGDVASLPLLVLLGSAASFILEPAGLALSRRHEMAADRYALALTHDRRACARTFIELQAENLQIPRPGPLVTLLRASHPPLGERIEHCLSAEISGR